MSELKQHGGKGMSYLLSAILFVMKDESESFWCFVALIERFGPNFNRDQNGMHSQLFALSKLPEISAFDMIWIQFEFVKLQTLN
ncbi:hypothetical protein V6Z11_A01G118400 [Gossypium hirsutum]